MHILSGDIGGTHTRLLITEFSQPGAHPEIVLQDEYPSTEFKSLGDIVEVFFKQHKIDPKSLHAACFAAAGPIVNDTVKFTNLPWYVDGKALAQRFNLNKVALINDFKAIALGIEFLQPDDLHVIQEGKQKAGAPRAVIGAGTGLGVAILVHDGERYHVIPTEGGHVDFAPTDETQGALLRYLRRKHHRVSDERIVSGMGVTNIYDFVRENPLYNEQENPELMRAMFNTDDQPALISEYAIKHQDPMALRAMDIFIRAYGSIAGNLALMTLCYGGLYIVGGIAPKLKAQMSDGRFLEMFTDKGRMSGLLNDVAVKIVLNGNVGQLGAALYGSLL